MKTLIKFWAPLLILFLLSPKTINSQVEKRVIGDCNRTTSSLFSGIDNIVFVKPEGAVYDLKNILDVTYKLSEKDIFAMTVLRLYFQLREKFVVTSIFKSQIPDKLDVNTLYVDLEKTKLKIEKNDFKELSWNFSYSIFDSNKKYFYNSGTLGTFYKRRGQRWIEDNGVARRVINTKIGDVLINAMNNPSDACQGNTRNYIGDEEIDNINYREAEKSFKKYWEKNYSKDPIEGIYSQTNYYSLFNVAETKGILKNDLYKIVIISDNSREFYNVYYLQNNKMELKIADLVAKIYKTNETNIFEIEYTNKFLQNDEFYNIQNTQMARSELSVDRLEFGSYKEPGTVKYGYSYRLSNHLYSFYEGESSKNYTSPWIGEMKGSPSENILIRASEGFFIKYNKFNNGIYFDAYFKRTFRPSEVQTASSTTNKPVNRKAKSSIKKKSAPPDAKIID